uniref:CSON004119 protein n=1 Tax=Culicoides sonorensis TaxID=179676 RepID=A0A336KDE2_CULSO
MEIDESSIEIDRKFRRILELLLTSKTRVRNDCYLEKLLQKIEEFCNPNLFKISFEWFLVLVKRCEELEAPHSTIVSFGLKLAMVCHKIDTTNTNNKIIRDQIMTRMLKTINNQQGLQTPSILLSYILLLKEVSRTEIGLKFIQENTIWRNLIDYKSLNFTIYIIREISSFIHEILKSFDRIEEKTTVKDILENLLSPLLNQIWIGIDHAVKMDDPDTKEIIYKMLNVFENLLLCIIEDQDLNYIPYSLFIEMGIENKLWKLRDISLSEQFSNKLILVLTTANYARFTCMKIPVQDTKTEQLKLEKFCINFYNFLHFGIMRISANIVLAVTELTTRLWYVKGPRRPTEELITSHKLKFGDQILMIQLMPMLYAIKSLSPSASDTDYIDTFCQGMYSLSCEHTIRHMYAVRDILRQNKKNRADLACRAINGIASSGPVLEKQRALIAFRAFLCGISEFLPSTFDLTQSAYLSFENSNFLLTLLTGVNNMIKTYKITCADIPDTNLHKIGLYLLNVSGLTTQQKVQVIKLLENALIHFASNQVPLMIGDLSGSGYEHLGLVIYKRLHDVDWDVRDSILELITSIIYLSKTKFSVLQTLILEDNFCTVILTLTKSDSELYVRASAIKCVKEMIGVNKFWTKITREIDLMEHFCQLLQTEQEAIVRREAVDVLIDIFSHERDSKSALNKVLPTMTYCAAIDLHWEVRINALKFWDRVLELCFIAEGMCDGSFPSQMFSTKLKKIIKLDDKTIKTKISSVLEEYWKLGGFGIIMANLEETTDIEVMKKTVEIIDKLKKKLLKYDYTEEKIDPNIDEKSQEMAELNKTELEPFPIISESDLDFVVDSDDINLLVNTHQNALKCESENRYENVITNQFTRITANHFLSTVHSKNFESLLNSKVDWNDHTTDSFESLLDDILHSYNEFTENNSDINGMDCY